MAYDFLGNWYDDGMSPVGGGDWGGGSPDSGSVYIPSVPGNDTTWVPTTDPGFNADPWAILQNVGKIAQSGVAAATSFLNTRDSLAFAKQDRALAQQKTQLQFDLARQQLTAQSSTDQARIQAQTAATNAALGRMTGTTALFGGTTPPKTADMLMLALTAVGVYFGWAALKGHGA